MPAESYTYYNQSICTFRAGVARLRWTTFRADRKIANRKIANRKIANRKFANRKIANRKIAGRKIANRELQIISRNQTFRNAPAVKVLKNFEDPIPNLMK